MPLAEDVEAYFEREVLPHAPDAWIDHDKTKVGYEIPFNRHFYVFKPPRPLAEIDAELKRVTDRILAHDRGAVGNEFPAVSGVQGLRGGVAGGGAGALGRAAPQAHRCRRVPSNVDKKSYDGEAQVLLCNYTDVYYNDEILPDMEFMAATATDEQIAKFTLRAGDTDHHEGLGDADEIASRRLRPA